MPPHLLRATFGLSAGGNLDGASYSCLVALLPWRLRAGGQPSRVSRATQHCGGAACSPSAPSEGVVSAALLVSLPALVHLDVSSFFFCLDTSFIYRRSSFRCADLVLYRDLFGRCYCSCSLYSSFWRGTEDATAALSVISGSSQRATAGKETAAWEQHGAKTTYTICTACMRFHCEGCSGLRTWRRCSPWLALRAVVISSIGVGAFACAALRRKRRSHRCRLFFFKTGPLSNAHCAVSGFRSGLCRLCE